MSSHFAIRELHTLNCLKRKLDMFFFHLTVLYEAPNRGLEEGASMGRQFTLCLF